MKKIIEFYDKIWENLDDRMIQEAEYLLSMRFIKNKIPTNLIIGKRILDIGCGIGRYSVALKKMGAKEVIGSDKSVYKKFRYRGVKYVKGNALKLPFEDNSFDFVFCNGVLHHTDNPEKGLREIHRVLKKEGNAWIFVVSKSKLWDMVDDLAKKLDTKDTKTFLKILNLFKVSQQKQFLLTDILFVRLRTYLTKPKLERLFKQIGFSKWRFLNRGLDFDFNERLYDNPKLKEYLGDGDLKYLLRK